MPSLADIIEASHLDVKRLVRLSLHDPPGLRLESHEDQLSEGVLEGPHKVHQDVGVHLQVVHDGHEGQHRLLHLTRGKKIHRLRQAHT